MSNAQLLWFSAVTCNRIDDIRYHLPKYGKTFNEDSETALMIAVRLNNLEIATILVDTEATLTNSDGRTALMIAAICGHTEVARLLVEREARIQDNYGMTALMLAIICDNKPIVELLANHESGLTTLKEVMIGCLNDNYIELEDNGTDVLSDSSSMLSTQTPTYASLDRDRRKVVTMQRKSLPYNKHIAPYYSVPTGYTSVLFAILCGDADSVALLSSEYNVSVYDRHMDRFITPSILSVESQQVDVLRVITSNGPCSLTESGHCALYIAILHGHMEFISLLFKCERHLLEDEHISMPPTMTWLIEKIVTCNPNYEDNPIFAEFLDSLFKSQNVREKDKHGMTLVMMGAALNLVWLVQAILDTIPEALCDVDCHGRTALHYAAAADSVDVGKVIQKRLIGSVDIKGCTSLMIAATHGSSAMVKSLRNESRLIDKQGHSALMLLILGAASCPFREQQDMILESAKYIIEEEAGIINSASRSALMLSIWHRFYDLALQLAAYEKGHQDKSGYTALILAVCVNCNNITLIDRLTQTESLMRLSNQFGGGKSALMLAIEKDANYMMLDTMLKSQFVTGLIDAAGYSALMYAIEKKNIEIGLRLAHVPAELGHACFAKRQTALMKSILSKQDDIAIVLAYRKSELHKQDYRGRTALMHAINSKNETLALILAESEQGYRDSNGKTALVHAIEKRPSFLYRLNIWNEALLSDKEGLTPLDYAKRCRSEFVQVKNRHTNAVTTHNLPIDLIVRSMEVSLLDSTRTFECFKEYMHRAYDRMVLFARQLLVRRHPDRHTDADEKHMNNNLLDNADAAISPTFGYNLMLQESPVISQWSTGVLQIADVLLDICIYDSNLQEFYTDIPNLLDEYLRTIKAIEDCHTLRGDDLYEDYCCICMDAPVRVVLIPCRHAVLCERCSLNIKKTCPICRHIVTGTIDINQ